MKKVKITILQTMLNEDLAKEYGICGLKACPMMKVGDTFYADYAKPEGFCDEAWKAIYQYVFALAHGADKGLFYYGDWIKKPGVAIVNSIVFPLFSSDFFFFSISSSLSFSSSSNPSRNACTLSSDLAVCRSS